MLQRCSRRARRIIVIAVFYTSGLSLAYIFGALAVFGLLATLARLRVMSLVPYLLGGALMWLLMLKSGVHATIAPKSPKIRPKVTFNNRSQTSARPMMRSSTQCRFQLLRLHVRQWDSTRSVKPNPACTKKSTRWSSVDAFNGDGHWTTNALAYR